MKPEDINYILNIVPNFSYGRRQGLSDEDTIRKSNQVWRELEDAFEKQVAKKPIYGEINYRTEDNFLGKEINCGVCNKKICYEHSVIEYFKYCSKCGTKIDWSEGE